MSFKKKLFTVASLTAVFSTAFSIAASAADNSSNSIVIAAASDWIPIIIYLVVIGLLFYFMIIRPQKKRTQKEQALRDSIVLGDEITTIGGIVGKVVNIKDDNITIETSIDKSLIEFKNWAIRDVMKLESDDTTDK